MIDTKFALKIVETNFEWTFTKIIDCVIKSDWMKKRQKRQLKKRNKLKF